MHRGFGVLQILLGVFVLALIGGGAYIVAHNNTTQQPVACTQEAKLCPDGSYVGRTGPNCEFAACPSGLQNNTQKTTPTIQVIDDNGDGPATITVQYSNLPNNTGALAVCLDSGACTEWVENFKPTSPSGSYMMSATNAFGAGSKKGLSNGKYKLILEGDHFGDEITSTDFTVPFSLAGYPTISRLSQSSGPTGTTLTIVGTGFGSNNGVQFGDQPVADAAASTNNGTEITFTIPQGDYCLTPTGHECPGPLTPGLYVVSVVNDGLNTSMNNPTFTVTTSTSSNISVHGMQQYTDTDFGFSFWYPSGWQITEVSNPYSNYGGPARKAIKVTNASATKTVVVTEVTTDRVVVPGITMSALSTMYQFDASRHTWMATKTDDFQLADTSVNSMGGLHMFATGSIVAAYVMPLTAHNFLVFSVTDGNGFALEGGDNGSFTAPLIKTIVATDAMVATPVSAAEQIATIEAEKAAYAGQ